MYVYIVHIVKRWFPEAVLMYNYTEFAMVMICKLSPYEISQSSLLPTFPLQKPNAISSVTCTL